MATDRSPATPQPRWIFVWLVPSEEVLDQPGSWRIRKWDTEPFPEANYALPGTASETASKITNAASVERPDGAWCKGSTPAAALEGSFDSTGPDRKRGVDTTPTTAEAAPSSVVSAAARTPVEWYEQEKAEFDAWWNRRGEHKFTEGPHLAAGAAWFERASRPSALSSAEEKPVAWRYKVHVTQQDWFYSWDRPTHIDARLTQPLYTRTQSASAFGTWRDPKDKPPHLPNQNHSEHVLILMRERGWIDAQPIRIGHVSCGHWRPDGGNGNFDDDVLGWMPLPNRPDRGREDERR